MRTTDRSGRAPELLLTSERQWLGTNRRREARVHPHKVRKRVCPHLAHHLTSVRLDGDLADAKFAADLLVQQTGDDQRHHFMFTRRERREAAPQLLRLRLLAECGEAALDGTSDGAQ